MNKDTKKSDKKQAATLPSLAKKINREHVACEKDIRSALDHARQCGQDLIAAKGLVKFGEFETWVVKNCKFSTRQARRYMTIAGGWEKILDLSKRTRASEMPLDSLSVREALRILSAGGPEELNPVYLDQTCPSCGERLVVTSTRFATCANCWKCRLYPLGHNDKKLFCEPRPAAPDYAWTSLDTQRVDSVKTFFKELTRAARDWPKPVREQTANLLREYASGMEKAWFPVMFLARQCQAAAPAAEEVQP